jgi:hypothetical protein
MPSRSLIKNHDGIVSRAIHISTFMSVSLEPVAVVLVQPVRSSQPQESVIILHNASYAAVKRFPIYRKPRELHQARGNYRPALSRLRTKSGPASTNRPVENKLVLQASIQLVSARCASCGLREQDDTHT